MLYLGRSTNRSLSKARVVFSGWDTTLHRGVLLGWACQLFPRQGDGSHEIRARVKVSPCLGLSFSLVSLRVSLGVATSFDCRCLFDPSGVCPFCLLVLFTGRVSFDSTASYCFVFGRCSKWYLRHVRLPALCYVRRHCYVILT